MAQSEYKPAVCQTHAFLCGKEGAALIRGDVESGAVNAVVIAACSPRVKAECFYLRSPDGLRSRQLARTGRLVS